jgi:hypothetical protein
MAKGMKALVSERAVTQRINRVLKAKGEVLRATRGLQRRQELGAWYVVDLNRGRIRTDYPMNLEALARTLGALQDWEVVS